MQFSDQYFLISTRRIYTNKKKYRSYFQTFCHDNKSQQIAEMPVDITIIMTKNSSTSIQQKNIVGSNMTQKACFSQICHEKENHWRIFVSSLSF